MASDIKYKEFFWSCSGFNSQEDAISARDDIEGWVNKTHGQSWTVMTSVRQGPTGWTAELRARLDG